ncbi:hypothetical protein [Companilactobacillus sp. HBUAS59699]|uniref:hypothetical protein n=1 Tax=Companilactobacillus sp. HBUAS59699 TaxID=3109358 RepID=UPI002FF06BF4
MSTKSFKTEFVFNERDSKNLVKALNIASNEKEELKVNVPITYLKKSDIRAINSLLKRIL